MANRRTGVKNGLVLPVYILSWSDGGVMLVEPPHLHEALQLAWLSFTCTWWIHLPRPSCQYGFCEYPVLVLSQMHPVGLRDIPHLFSVFISYGVKCLLMLAMK